VSWRLTECEYWRDGGSYSAVIESREQVVGLWLQVNSWNDPSGRRYEALYLSRGSDPTQKQERLASSDEARWLVVLSSEVAIEHAPPDARERFAELVAELENRASSASLDPGAARPPAGIAAPEYGRFWRYFSVTLVLVSAAGGAAQVLQAGYALRPFGVLEIVPSILAIGTLRENAPGVVLTAGSFAWVALCHGADRSRIQELFAGAALRSAMACPLAFPVAACVSFLAGFGAWTVFGIEAEVFASGLFEKVVWTDVLFGLYSTAGSTGLTILFGRFVVPGLARFELRLGVKLVALFATLVALRTCVKVTEGVLEQSSGSYREVWDPPLGAAER
jgi:hypothetical protein